MKSEIENIIERVIDYAELDIDKDMDTRKRKQTIQWGIDRIMDIIEEKIQPHITEIVKLLE